MSTTITAPKLTAILSALLDAIRVAFDNGNINETLTTHEASIVSLLAARNTMPPDCREVFDAFPKRVWKLCTAWKNASGVLSAEAIASHKKAIKKIGKTKEGKTAQEDANVGPASITPSKAAEAKDVLNNEVRMDASPPPPLPPSHRRPQNIVASRRPTPVTPTPAPRGEAARISLPMSQLRLTTPNMSSNHGHTSPIGALTGTEVTARAQDTPTATIGNRPQPAPDAVKDIVGHDMPQDDIPTLPQMQHIAASIDSRVGRPQQPPSSPGSPKADRGEGPSKRRITPTTIVLRNPRKAHKPSIIVPTPIRRNVRGRYIEINDEDYDDDVKEEDMKQDEEDDNDGQETNSENDNSDGDKESGHSDDITRVIKVKKERKETTVPRGRSIRRSQGTTKSRQRSFHCGSTERVPPCARCAAMDDTTCHEQLGRQGGACFACSKSRKRCVPHGEPLPQRRRPYARAVSKSQQPRHRKIKSPPASSPPRISAKDKGKQREEPPPKPAPRRRTAQNRVEDGEDLAARIAALIAEQMDVRQCRMERHIEQMLDKVTKRLDNLENTISSLHTGSKSQGQQQSDISYRPPTDSSDIRVEASTGPQFRTLAAESPQSSTHNGDVDNAMDVDQVPQIEVVPAPATTIISNIIMPPPPIVPPALVIIPPTPQNSQDSVTQNTENGDDIEQQVDFPAPVTASPAATFLAALATRGRQQRDRASSLLPLRRSPRLGPPIETAGPRSRSTSNPLRRSERVAFASVEAAQHFLRELKTPRKRSVTPNIRKRGREDSSDDQSKRPRRI